MNEKQRNEATDRGLAESLLNLEEAGEGRPAAHEQVRAVLARDRRRIRVLTGLAVLFALLAVVGMYLVYYSYYCYIHPKTERLFEDFAARAPGLDAVQLAGIGFQTLYWHSMISLWLVGASIFSLMLAALSTVLLIFTSRRATLRQVSTSLREISEQLKQLQAATGRSPTGHSSR